MSKPFFRAPYSNVLCSLDDEAIAFTVAVTHIDESSIKNSDKLATDFVFRFGLLFFAEKGEKFL